MPRPSPASFLSLPLPMPLNQPPLAFLDSLPTSSPLAPTPNTSPPLPIPTPASHQCTPLLSQISDCPYHCLQCWYCKKKGHLKKDCPKKMLCNPPNCVGGQKEDYAARFCPRCNINQHTFPDCHWDHCPHTGR